MKFDPKWMHKINIKFRLKHKRVMWWSSGMKFGPNSIFRLHFNELPVTTLLPSARYAASTPIRLLITMEIFVARLSRPEHVRHLTAACEWKRVAELNGKSSLLSRTQSLIRSSCERDSDLKKEFQLTIKQIASLLLLLRFAALAELQKKSIAMPFRIQIASKTVRWLDRKQKSSLKAFRMPATRRFGAQSARRCVYKCSSLFPETV